jgi:ubiquinone/menaquinone biosynthesis C-methylase UbiE
LDAEQLALAEGSFVVFWSWGVIHHSANTRRILDEMHRVLRPGGSAVVMVYHRGFWR